MRTARCSEGIALTAELLQNHRPLEVARTLLRVGLDAANEVGLRLTKHLHQLGQLCLKLGAERRPFHRRRDARLALGEKVGHDCGGGAAHERGEILGDGILVFVQEALRRVAHLRAVGCETGWREA